MFKFLKKKKAAKNARQATQQAAVTNEQNPGKDTSPKRHEAVVQAPDASKGKANSASEAIAPAGQAMPEKAATNRLEPQPLPLDAHAPLEAGPHKAVVAPEPATQPPPRPETSSQTSPQTSSNEGLEHKLDKSRAGFGKKFKQLFSVRKKIDEDLMEDIETTLLLADVGATATTEIVDQVARSVKRRQLDNPQAVMGALREHLQELASSVEKPLTIDDNKKPFVILVTGVNGVGKTTTIAKLARRFREQGKSVMLAAGDTFRAAAVEQLKTWGEREGIPVIAQATGADSASVIFDAMSSARAKGVDVLIADTAGRLHTQSNLMQELEKINRVMKKADPEAPHETLIVVDGGTGQNAIAQVREFNKAVNLTGIAVTKLDGTAKGGVLFNLAREFGLPVRFIGVGEKSSDLKPYRADEFVAALME